MAKAGQLPLRFRVEGALVSIPGVRRLVQIAQGRRKRIHALVERRRRTRSPLNLGNFERKVYSQNGEDGILEEVFRRIGVTNRFFLEFGVQNGTECCSRHLLEQGWSGVWGEADSALVDDARIRFAALPIKVVQRFLTRENVVSTFREAGVPAEFDFMAIDTNGNDYWLWEAMGQVFKPRVVTIEYNASLGRHTRWIMPYDPEYVGDDTVYFGASIASYADLGARLGYELVACDAAGVNAIFVRRELVDEQFEKVSSPLEHYNSPQYGGWFGWPVKRLD